MRLFILILSLLAVVVVGYVATSTYLYRMPMDYAAKTITIEPHTGARAILAQLHEEGVVPSAPFMLPPVFMSGMNRKLKAGEYEIEAGLTPAQVISKIARGDIVVHKVTIPEGWTAYQVREALNAEPLLSGGLPEQIEEGSVFPDTVHFTRGEPRAAVLARMQRKHEEVMMELWAARDQNLPFSTPEQALILASVVEKETGIPAERGIIAGVFLNRLRINMALQSDPTVAYGVSLQQGGKPLSRPLTVADLRADTAYNSYTRIGLPIGPICNPGRDAIFAVLHPTPTQALYFVATGHGGHNFAETLAEHERNVATYRRTAH